MTTSSSTFPTQAKEDKQPYSTRLNEEQDKPPILTRLTLFRNNLGFYQFEGPLSDSSVQVHRLDVDPSSKRQIVQTLSVTPPTPQYLTIVKHGTSSKHKETQARSEIRLGDTRGFGDLLASCVGVMFQIWTRSEEHGDTGMEVDEDDDTYPHIRIDGRVMMVEKKTQILEGSTDQMTSIYTHLFLLLSDLDTKIISIKSIIQQISVQAVLPPARPAFGYAPHRRVHQGLQTHHLNHPSHPSHPSLNALCSYHTSHQHKSGTVHTTSILTSLINQSGIAGVK
eukprot:GHVN01078802.1.p1 GENE.GHVN01078802.1~~GHVN01078802.1.p1  ORF type:complete len:304 (+),score=53.70 GHVN01078802.1:70-912(+)